MGAGYENIVVMGKSGAGKQPRIDVLVAEFGLRQLSTGGIFRTYLGCFDALGHEGDLNEFYLAAEDRFRDDEEIEERLGIRNHPNVAGIVLGLKAKYYVDQGRFVPDSITNHLFESAFHKMDYRHAVLDGYPRTVEQARFLWELSQQQNIRLDAVLLVDNDDELIRSRTVGRRICRSCGKVYHLEYNPPRNNTHCTAASCGGETIQRSDDTLEKIQSRLDEFHAKTVPTLDFLKAQGIPIHTVSGNLREFTPEAVRASVLEALHPG